MQCEYFCRENIGRKKSKTALHVLFQSGSGDVICIQSAVLNSAVGHIYEKEEDVRRMSPMVERNQSRISGEGKSLCNAHSLPLDSFSSSLTRAHCVNQRQDSLLVVTCSALPFLAVLSGLRLSLAMLLAEVCQNNKKRAAQPNFQQIKVSDVFTSPFHLLTPICSTISQRIYNKEMSEMSNSHRCSLSCYN